MKFRRPLLWLLLSIACFVGAVYFWRLGNVWQAKKQNAAHSSAAVARQPAGLAGGGQEIVTPASTAPVVWSIVPGSTNAPKAAAASRARLRYRLSNTTGTVNELARNQHGILLENALIDTSRPLGFSIPEHLRAQAEPGSYIVQARGPIDDAFRAALREAGAEIVSYIPNNAFLVRASSGAARTLSAGPAQAVLPFEPYYKLSPALLGYAVEQQPLPEGTRLVVVVPESSAGVLEPLGLPVATNGLSPFGTVLTVEPGPNGLPAMARLPETLWVGISSPRVPANDLSRARVGVAPDSVSATNYLELSGSNIVVQVNDTGVDANHPALTARVFSDNAGSLQDVNGHGTHVAATIAGDGTGSESVTNASGSTTTSTTNLFRGMAPLAKLFSLPFSRDDFSLQQSAARTNALISNNSWTYSGGGYDIFAASYDAAVRDALPEVTGSQPVVFVFAAGNTGNGTDDGFGISSGSIQSPATAKNVITVGALEQPRNITNEVVIQETTNKFWLEKTDRDNEVADFSSRGNVGVGVEGDFGRYKPDVVAPGVFVVSARSAQWDDETYYDPTYLHANSFIDSVAVGDYEPYAVNLPYNVVRQLDIFVEPLFQDVDMPIYYRSAAIATPETYDQVGTNFLTFTGAALIPGRYFYSVANPTNEVVRYRVRTTYWTTNDFGNYFEVLSNLNETIGPLYRYESGTSMAAADVSGVLALMMDFFTNRLQVAPPSPTLMRALLINGARGVNQKYNFNVRKELNDQGWGVVNLTNSVPAGLTNQAPATVLNPGPSTVGPMLMYDQSPTNAVATGDRRTVKVMLDPAARNVPLRVTLTWTDPPGNPAAGIKLVNDLDLVVTNLDDPSLIYMGNDIDSGSTFNSPWNTNEPPTVDVVNNVENVFINTGLGTNYSITVIGKLVNVNAITAHTNNVAQDYALVISSGDGALENALTVVGPTLTTLTNSPQITALTNQFTTITNIAGQLLLNQHLGASTPLFGTNAVPLIKNSQWATNESLLTVGVTNQWHFYILTNTTTFTNAAFVTFLSVDLGLPRMGVTNVLNPDNATRPEADIDLYVTTDPGLLVLSSNALFHADKSLTRDGTEVIVYSNAVPGATYFVGVKSEDQEAAEYGFFGVFSEQPFSETQNGIESVRGINVPSEIPDGTPDQPKATIVMGISVNPITIRRVIATNTVTHQRFADLFGNLNHNRINVVLHNHSLDVDSLAHTFVYEDNGETSGLLHSDGPGSLIDYLGEEGIGLWTLTEVDNASQGIGRVDDFWLRLEPSASDDTNGVVFDIEPFSFAYDFVDVPPEATNLVIIVDNESASPLPLELYVRRGELPTRLLYDYTKVINPPGDQLSISTADLPPLMPGRYYIGIYNPNASKQTVRLRIRLELSTAPIVPSTFSSTALEPIRDDAVSYSTISITNLPDNVEIARAQVAVGIAHPRVSDLALTLINPRGERFLLMENRGGPNASDLGSTVVTTNFLGGATNGFAAPLTNVIGPVPTTGVLLINYDFYGVPDTIDVYYDGVNIFSRGLTSFDGQFVIPYGPGVSTNISIVINQGTNPEPGTAWEYTSLIVSQSFSYFIFTDNTNLTRVPIKFFPPPYTFTNATPSGVSVLSGPIVNPANSHAYYRLGPQNWSVSESWAVALGGHLATINNQAEQDWVVATFQGATRQLWIGLHDQDRNGVFEWISGEPVNFTAWAPGEPTPNEYWVYMRSAFGSQWNNYSDLSTVLGEPLNGVVEVSPPFAHPEEILKPLIGDDPVGTWTLEVRDARVGATSGGGFVPRISSWQLQFILATNTPAPARLVHGVPVTKTVPPCEITYFAVDAPPWAQFASNELFSVTGPVTLIFNSARAPFRGLGTDFVLTNLPSGSTGGTNVLGTNAPAPFFIPGNRYYLAVTNDCSSTGTVTFTIEVEFDITALTNSIPFNAVMSANPWPRYFYYDVSTNATAVAFLLTNIVGGNLDLVARRGAPLPEYFSYDDGSFNPGTLDEDIIVLSNNVTPAVLSPGIWYLGVFPIDQVPTTYSIVAIEYTNPISAIITLTNGIPYYNSNSAAGDPTDYYRYVVSTNAARVQFEINTPSDDVTLVARKGLPPPTLGDYTYISANVYTNDELIVVLTNSSPVALSPGDWFLSAVNVSGVPVSYSIKATEWPITGQPVNIIGSGITGSGTNLSFCFTWESLPGAHYFVQGIADLRSTNWTTISPTITAVDTTTTWCEPLPSPYNFFRVGEGLVLSTYVPPPVLLPGTTITNTIAPCQTAYYAVDVPAGVAFATNVLVSATAPVNVWFNPSLLPAGGTNAADVLLLTNAVAGSATLSTSGTPPLVPGVKYYLGVENPCANGTNVTIEIRVDFDVQIITLTNAIAFFNVNSGAGNTNDYYHFVVSPGMARAQFDVNGPNRDVTLVARKGWPPPTLGTFDYLSANPGINDELIVVFTNSTPRPLASGDWYLTVVNVSGAPVSYSVLATEWPATGSPIVMTGGALDITGTSFCVAWDSMPGVHYYLIGATNLPATSWDVVSGTITAIGTSTTHCIALPSPYHFFRVVEGMVVAPPSLTVRVTPGPGGYLLEWTGPATAQYQVEWTATLSPPGWSTIPTIITSATGQFSFLDDGSQTGGFGGLRFYRVVRLP